MKPKSASSQEKLHLSLNQDADKLMGGYRDQPADLKIWEQARNDNFNRNLSRDLPRILSGEINDAPDPDKAVDYIGGGATFKNLVGNTLTNAGGSRSNQLMNSFKNIFNPGSDKSDDAKAFIEGMKPVLNQYDALRKHLNPAEAIKLMPDNDGTKLRDLIDFGVITAQNGRSPALKGALLGAYA